MAAGNGVPNAFVISQLLPRSHRGRALVFPVGAYGGGIRPFGREDLGG